MRSPVLGKWQLPLSWWKERLILASKRRRRKLMFEASWGQWIVTAFAVVLAYWTYKSDKEDSQKRKIRHQEEKALIADCMVLTTTRVKFERYLWMLLDHVASYKLQRIIITDEKEIPQSVLLPYAAYKLLLECYDKEKAKDLAPFIEEQIKNAQAGNTVSHEDNAVHR